MTSGRRESAQEKRKRRPASIDLGESELRICWRDGRESRFPLEELRLQCPCAVCRQARGEPHGPQLVGDELPLVTASTVHPTSEAAGFDPVGRYGIKIRWADGHDAGIYTFEMLHEMAADS